MGANNHKVVNAINVIQSLPDRVVGTAQTLKAMFDNVGEIVRLKHNDLCDYIDNDLATKAEIQGLTLGQIVDGTITTAKLDPDALQANMTKLSSGTASLHGLTNVDDVLALIPFAKYYGKYSQMSGGSGHDGSAGAGVISFTSEDNDDFGVISIPTSATQMVIPASLNGRKAVFYWYGRVNGGTGYIQSASASLRKNGTNIFTFAHVSQGNNAGTGSGTGLFKSVPFTLATGEYYEVYASASTTSSQNSSVSAGSIFGMEIIA